MEFSYNNQFTLNLGDNQADHRLIVFANLGCPFCKKWYANNFNRMLQAVENHQLVIHLKFWNKPKQSLHNGNIANLYVDYQNPRAALGYVKEVFSHQNILDHLSSDQVAGYLTSHFNVSRSVSSKAKEAISEEARNNRITSVPTIIFDGNLHADSGFNLPL